MIFGILYAVFGFVLFVSAITANIIDYKMRNFNAYTDKEDPEYIRYQGMMEKAENVMSWSCIALAITSLLMFVWAFNPLHNALLLQ